MSKTETLHEMSSWGAAPASEDRSLASSSGDADASARLPGPGEYIRHYEIIRELGRGGMGAVYLARDTKLGRRVAIKFLLADSYQLTERFLVEARITAQCTHEHIVVVHEVNEHRGHPFMVLEYLQGDTLLEALRGQTVTASRAVELMLPVVRALVQAHGMGIVHRDLKPGNIMLTQTGGIKVLDFGIVKLLSERDRLAVANDQIDSQIDGLHHDLDGRRAPTAQPDAVHAPEYFAVTHTGALIGTLPYMSPEQITAGPVDHRTDLWAVGIMLCELVTGRHPLGTVVRERLLTMGDMDVPMPRMSELAPDLGPLGSIIDRCLIKERADRIASAEALLAELEPLMSAESGRLAEGENPFAGLSAFQKTDAARFFGRDDDIASVVARVRSEPLTAVVGPSGTGKSSLVRAGVIPALERSGEGWRALIVRPGRHPVAALATSLAQLGPDSSERAQTGGLAESDLGARLLSEPGYLGAALRARAARRRRRFIIFVDQFEELYTQGAAPEHRAAFLACLAGVADDATSPLRVVLSMRSDLLDRLARDRAFMAHVTRGLVLLPPMGRDNLRDALVEPLALAGYRFEQDALVDDMVDAFDATPSALPLLQFAAARLWESRDRERRLITLASYQAMGGLAGALASHADAVLAGLSAAQRQLARVVLERLVTPERTRAIASTSELAALGDPAGIAQVVQDLADARLLAIESDEEGEGGAVELIHESLVTGWPTLRRWLDEHQDDAVFLARLREATRQWERGERQDGMLWRGAACREARAWRERYLTDLPGREQAFLDAVFALDVRSRRRRRISLAAIAVVVTALVVVATVMLTQMEQLDTIRAQEAQLEAQRAQLQRSLATEEEARKLAESASEKIEAARAREEARAKEAEEARDALDVQRAAAVAAREEAVREREKAEEARDAAKAQEEETARQRDRAEKLQKQAESQAKIIDQQRRAYQRLAERQGIEKLDLSKRPKP